MNPSLKATQAEVEALAVPMTMHLLLWLWKNPEPRGRLGRTARAQHPGAVSGMSYRDRDRYGVG